MRIIFLLLIILTVSLALIGCETEEEAMHKIQLSEQQESQEAGLVQQTNTLKTISSYQTANPSCARGVTNDPYPGQCGSYHDANNNGLCNLGEY